MESFADVIIVGIDYKADSDHAILLVGRRKFNKEIEIINALEGDEALELYQKLIKKKDDKQ